MKIEMPADESITREFSRAGFAHVADLFSAEIADTAYRYALLRIERGHGITDKGETPEGAREEYGDFLMETLLERARPRMERIVGRKLWPTYSFYRLYKEGMGFRKHRDRPACEYSASICLGRDFSNLTEDYDWPLYADGTPVPCPPGGGVIYLGREVTHWRTPLKGIHQVQLFLHYVDQNGEFGDRCRFDTRPGLGFPSGSRDSEAVKRLSEKTI